LLLAQINGLSCGDNLYQAGKILISIAGNLRPQELSAAHITEFNDYIGAQGWAHSTKVSYSRAASRHLRWLWEFHGAKKLDKALHRCASPRPPLVSLTSSTVQLPTFGTSAP
jgi:hypothetical protein